MKPIVIVWALGILIVTATVLLFAAPMLLQTRSGSSSQPGCNSETLNHVYSPDRLQVHNSCQTVTGTVMRILQERDGDTHIRLQLDPQYTGLLNDYNMQDQKGTLILEIVCAYSYIPQQDAVSACQGYTNQVPIPNVGQHVSVVGQYVTDLDHGWNEIHPVYSVATI
ncbi:MAG TPA: hypothetical protein VJL56_05015 [Candidatus Bathyarchaeia archaeon]|nr:hypothetical protein [Candidatus Bathyarchaeia archaeon]